MEERLIQYGVATINTIDEIIRCLEEFDFCYPIDTEEAKEVYQISEGGFLFPSLRPKKDFYVLVVQMENKLKFISDKLQFWFKNWKNQMKVIF